MAVEFEDEDEEEEEELREVMVRCTAGLPGCSSWLGAAGADGLVSWPCAVVARTAPAACPHSLPFAAASLPATQDDDEEEEAEEEGGGGGVRTGGMDVDAGEEAADDGIPVQEIDAYWLQRRISKAFGDIDPTAAQKLAEDVFEALQLVDGREVENKLVMLLDFDRCVRAVGAGLGWSAGLAGLCSCCTSVHNAACGSFCACLAVLLPCCRPGCLPMCSTHPSHAPHTLPPPAHPLQL